MKKTVLQVSSWLVLVVLLAVGSAQAQTINQYTAQIPFDFKIGNKGYKAGDYVIGIKNLFTPQVTLTIREANKRNEQIMLVVPSGKRLITEKTYLVFNRYDNRYFLGQMVSSEFGLMLPKSGLEKRLAKGFRRENSQAETVAITLSGPDEKIE